MSRAGRLASLLRTFHLSPGASASDLKQAYFKEAKRLHPDTKGQKGHAASKDFLSLKDRYEEAMGLLEKVKNTDWHQHSQDELHRGPYGFREDGSNFNSGRQHNQSWETGPHSQESAIPCTGFPERTVYMITGAIVSIFAAFLGLKVGSYGEEDFNKIKSMREFKDPAVAEQNQRNSAASLRQALELSSGEQHAGLGVGVLCGQPENATAARRAAESDVMDAPHQDASWYHRVRRARRAKSNADEGGVGAQFRDGVALNPVHVAAQDGYVWWLERCGAVPSCHALLNERDRRGDTPLHHCARRGQGAACRTLLRLGADPDVQNKWQLWSEDLAAHEGHTDLADLLRHTRLKDSRSSSARSLRVSQLASSIGRHPDSLGMLAEPSGGVVYFGPHSSESLRHAVNLAAGSEVLQHLRKRSGESASGSRVDHVEGAVQQALDRVRNALEDSGFTLEAAPVSAASRDPYGWASHEDGKEVCGLLVFEPPGQVSRDAPGHWVAVRHARGPTMDEQQTQQATGDFFRLDPVRGPFRLKQNDMATLLTRYRAWRVVRESQLNSKTRWESVMQSC